MMNIHFIGIGGIGMSALAGISMSKGDKVSGSDLRPNSITDRLAREGAMISKGHQDENLAEGTDLVVRSTCIRDDNPEILAAKRCGIPVISRGELLNRFLSAAGMSVSVTGTHGKTTTSSLVAHISSVAGSSPTFIVGGEVLSLGGNAGYGGEELVVAEVDESDGYFRNISTDLAVITNIEREHLEFYGTFTNLVDAYSEFISRISRDGTLIYNGEDSVLDGIARHSGARRVSFGIEGDFDYSCKSPSWARGIEFELFIHGESAGKVKSLLKGRYNVMNILGALGAVCEMGIPVEDAINAVGSFRGVKRRFELVGKMCGVEIYEDYAHHPTEIRSVIRAAREYASGRVIAVFQPHRYSRTKDLMDEFSTCFDDADGLVLTDIYSADEDILADVNVYRLKETIERAGFRKGLVVVRKDEIPDVVSGMAGKGDVVLVLGAGDIREVAAHILTSLGAKSAGA
ncbi:MAG: UDP-N-acetylmuramate--L-alanine ligase [Candidatus Omnitrophica bacterium]|nr:UDP-N-acetylmuramate--L-alanine ligase [Candidatus Omnitrophota bacterium]MDD5488018.1 UDP-N-acetylmuramate--L-alanine ligase [Candidatus Omnitrophota bacterium]